MVAITLVSSAIGTVFCFFLYQAWKVYRSPLHRIPGPFWAKWTNIWRLLDVMGGRSELTQKVLHEKYGRVVRLGPNMVSLSDPSLIKLIYGIKGNWRKTEFYHGNSVLQGGKIVYTLFSETNNDIHAQMKRPISKLYSLNGVLPIEAHIDDVVSYFCKRLEQEFTEGQNSGRVCDIGAWLLYYTWDVVGKATFSTLLGFLDKASDVDNTLYASEKALDYFAAIGMMPFLDFWFDKNPVYRLGPPSFSFITATTIQRLQARLTGQDKHDPSKPDFLDKFLETKKEHPEIVDDNMVVSYLLINMIAGADTTAITLRSIIYFTLKHPRVYRRLRKELDGANLTAPVSYKDARTLPYLEAVLRESTRMHPGVGMPLERYVPQEGFTVDGHYLPPGTIVGINPWISGLDKDVYGQDAASFRPERWLREEDEEQEEYERRLQRMNSCDLTFGAGSRICIGKNLAFLEVYKVIPTLFLLYDIQLADPKKDWEITNSWFVRQEGIEVKISPRTKNLKN